MRQIAWVVAFILFGLFGLPFLLQKGWVPLPSHSAVLVLDRHLHVRRDLQPSHARPRSAHRQGRPRVAVPVHVALWWAHGSRCASTSCGPGFPTPRCCSSCVIPHGRDRHPHRPSRAAFVRSVSRPHHADGGRGDHRAAQGAAVPERRRWLLGGQEGQPHLRDQSAVDRARRHRVLPLLRVRRDRSCS